MMVLLGLDQPPSDPVARPRLHRRDRGHLKATGAIGVFAWPVAANNFVCIVCLSPINGGEEL